MRLPHKVCAIRVRREWTSQVTMQKTHILNSCGTSHTLIHHLKWVIKREMGKKDRLSSGIYIYIYIQIWTILQSVAHTVSIAHNCKREWEKTSSINSFYVSIRIMCPATEHGSRKCCTRALMTTTYIFLFILFRKDKVNLRIDIA